MNFDIENLTPEQEKKLQQYFINLGEVGGMPIVKDNCEDMFENWLENSSEEELIAILN